MQQTPQRVLWTQGMLLSPQHLQQQDDFHERSRELRLQSIAPHAWGVASLQLDAQALAQGQVRVTQLQAIMASGLGIQVGQAGWQVDGTDRALSRPLGEHFLPSQQRLRVYVAVARPQHGAANAALHGPPGAHQRYVARRRPVPEFSQGATPAVDMAFAEPHLQLLFDSELAGSDMEALCVGELVRDAAGALAWAHDYVPPCLHVGAAPYLGRELRRLSSQLHAKLQHLAVLCRHPREATQPLHMADVVQLQQLAGLRAAQPWLQDLAHAPDTSPQLAALMLKQTVGHLGMLSHCEAPPMLPQAQQHDLANFFRAAFAALDALLGGGGQSPPVRLPLTPGPGSSFAHHELSAAVSAESICLLAVRGPAEASDWPERWARFARVAAADELPQLIRVAAEGVPLTHLPRPPAHVPWQPDTVYLALDRTHPTWQDVLRDGTLAVALPPGMDPEQVFEIALLVLQPAPR